MAEEFGRAPQGAGLFDRDAVAEAGRRTARRCHRRPDGRDRRSRRQIFLWRDSRRPRAESRAAPCRATRPAGAVEGAGQDRRRDPERQSGVRHHCLPGTGLLLACECAFDPDRAGIDPALRQSRDRQHDRAAARQYSRRRRHPDLRRAISWRCRSAFAPRRTDRRDLAEQPRRRRSRALSRPARGGSAGISDLPRRPCLQPGAAVAGAPWLQRRTARHRSGAARPVRIHAARRLRRLRGQEAKRRGSLRRHSEALFGVLPADRRWPDHRAAPADAAASFGKCRPMSALADRESSELTARDLPRAEELDRALRDASPAEVIAAALHTVGREHLAVVSSFGTESAALLKVMADVDPAIPVVFLDTGWLFEETLAYRDTLIATLGLRDVRSIKPLEETLSREDPDRELWFSDPDACCRIRKVEPLARALAPFSAWINGRKRFQGGLRADLPVVEEDGLRLKFNPLANVSREDIEAIYALAKLPPHPLVTSGFLSVGCMPCTSRTAPDEDRSEERR